MDALALLCNLHGDGPETLRRLRAAGCLDLAQVGELPRAQLDRLLGRGSLAAERFRREGRLLEKRLVGDVALTDGVVATGALGGSEPQGRAQDSNELREWLDAGTGGRGAEATPAPEARPSAGSKIGEAEAGARDGKALGSDLEGAPANAASTAPSGGLVHPFPPRKRPEAPRPDEPAAGSVLGAFLDRWRDTPEAPSPEAPSPVESPSSKSDREPEVEAAPSAIRQLAEWAQQTRASQRDATEPRTIEPRTAGPRTAGQRSAAAPAAASRAQAQTTGVEPAEEVEAERTGARALPGDSSPRETTPARSEAPAIERAPRPRTSGRASELLGHWTTRGAEPAGTAGTRPAAGPAPAAAPSQKPAGGTPLGRLPGGERCGPSLEALAFAGLTCLEDLAQASARQLAERSGLAYTEVLRLQFLAERYLSRS